METWADMSDDVKALYAKADEFESLFSDIMFSPDGPHGDLLICRNTNTGEKEIIDRPEALEYFSLSHFTFRTDGIPDGAGGYFDPEEQELAVLPKYKDDDVVLLHELIHLHEFVLDSAPSFYRDIALLGLYNDLKSKISNLDDRIREHSYMLKQNALAANGGIHDILFLLKSYDLDMREGYPIGTIYAYDESDIAI